jgi:hypothetical protein
VLARRRKMRRAEDRNDGEGEEEAARGGDELEVLSLLDFLVQKVLRLLALLVQKRRRSSSDEREVLSLLALIVQKYKYLLQAAATSARCSAYLLYWYTSTNTDAEGAARGSERPPQEQPQKQRQQPKLLQVLNFLTLLVQTYK